ncbi:MAG: hypothetical protein GY869_32615, partial [Planctomycetes bacterium]|nr:hypothetical protein [Planctomycetota bacterium]
AGGYRVSLVNQQPPEKINKTLDFFNIFRFNEHEDYIYGQRRERKIGLFEFKPGEHSLKLVCIGANSQSINPETQQPGYNLSADVLSLRLIPTRKFMEDWIKKVDRAETPANGANGNNKKNSDKSDLQDSSIATPQELWLDFEKSLPELEFTVGKHEIFNSDTKPDMQLRRMEVKFYSQEIDGKKWGHPCVVFTPADPTINAAPERRGKVVIVGQRSWDGLATGPWRDSFLGNYGEPIAALTGYPTMICPVPGEYDGSEGREISIGFLNDLCRETQNPTDHNYFRLAAPYLRALDVMAELLKVERSKVRAVIGGHSKRATSAITAAAADPERIAGVVYMGNESTWGSTRNGPFASISPAFTKDFVEAKVLYLGATNEDGYKMFNINTIQEIMEGAWTIEYIPNYRHASMSEKHFIDWRMWVAHVFDDRGVSEINDLSCREVDQGFEWGGRSVEAGTLFRARIKSPNKIIQAKIWYVYNDDEPFWRDLMWYPEFMVRQDDGYYYGYVKGRLPDAWLVEVKDTGAGYAGYVSSLPQDITGKDTAVKVSKGSRSKNWYLKIK